MNASSRSEIEAGIEDALSRRGDRTHYAFDLTWNESDQCFNVTIKRDDEWMAAPDDPLCVPEEAVAALGSLKEVGRQIAALALARSEERNEVKPSRRRSAAPAPQPTPFLR